MNKKLVTVVGGSGFLGRYIVKILVQAGYRIRVLCRDGEAAKFLRTAGDLGQIAIQHADISMPETLHGKLDGSYAVINLVGVLYESGAQTFNALQWQGAGLVATLAKDAGVKRFVHISALGVDKATDSAYAGSKLMGERAVLAAFPLATILRPGLIFGAEDRFFNRFARMAMVFNILPLIGGGKTLFQPVYVMDVARAAASALEQDSATRKIYELGGPQVYSFKELLRFIARETRRKPFMIPIPFPLAKLMGVVAGWLPVPPLTLDQVRLLQHDVTVKAESLKLQDLGVSPTALEQTVPEYIARYRSAAA